MNEHEKAAARWKWKYTCLVVRLKALRNHINHRRLKAGYRAKDSKWLESRERAKGSATACESTLKRVDRLLEGVE